MMICSGDDDSSSVTDYNIDDLTYQYFSLLSVIFNMFVWMFLTTHVTLCVCHDKLKDYLLTYLIQIYSVTDGYKVACVCN